MVPLQVVLLALLGQTELPKIDPTVPVEVWSGGPHYTVVHTFSVELPKADTIVYSPWLQVGYVRGDKLHVRYNPGGLSTLYFTLSSYGGASNDSVALNLLFWECSPLDTTSGAYWLADSSNFSIFEGAQSSPLFGLWAFSPVSKRPNTGRTSYVLPLRILSPCWVRFGFRSGVSDSVRVSARLVLKAR